MVKVGFDFDDTTIENTGIFYGSRTFMLRCFCGMVAPRDLFIISARKPCNVNVNEIVDYLFYNHIHISKDNIYLGYSGIEKGTLAKSLDIRIFFDDDPVTIKAMVDNGIDGMLIGAFLSDKYKELWRKSIPDNILKLYPEERRNG